MASRCTNDSAACVDSGPKGVGPRDQSQFQLRPVASDQKSAVSATPQPGCVVLEVGVHGECCLAGRLRHKQCADKVGFKGCV